ncbi:MAG: YdcF family protein [Defluviitaleaceae bacterium]|nr:YdcF family protein [Defluviitaleaceae bacterium]
MRILILAIGILLALNVIALATFSSIHHGHTIQAILSAVILLYAAFYNKLPKKFHIATHIVAAIPVTFVLFLMIYGNISHVNHQEDVVIVLGAGLHNGEVGDHLALRLNTALSYLSYNPQAMVIVCGGLGTGQPHTEAYAMARYLTTRGIPPERILLEDRSTNTYENLAFAKEILAAHFPYGFTAALVTNDFHIFRAAQLANQVGIDATPLGAPTPWHSLTVNYLREMLAIINMWIFG